MNLFAPTLGADSVIEDALFLLIDAGIILISLATVMCLYRIIKGPTSSIAGWPPTRSPCRSPG